MPTLIFMFQLSTSIPLGHLIHIALSPAHLACSAVKDEKERAVSYKVYKVEDEDKNLRLSSVCCGLYSSSLIPMSICVHTHRLKRQKLFICSFSVLQKHFLLLVGVVTVHKNFKVYLTFHLMFSSAKSWIERDHL